MSIINALTSPIKVPIEKPKKARTLDNVPPDLTTIATTIPAINEITAKTISLIFSFFAASSLRILSSSNLLCSSRASFLLFSSCSFLSLSLRRASCLFLSSSFCFFISLAFANCSALFFSASIRAFFLAAFYCSAFFVASDSFAKRFFLSSGVSFICKIPNLIFEIISFSDEFNFLSESSP